MAQLVVTDIELNGLSAAGVVVLKAVIAYASARKDVRSHRLSVDDFCTMVGMGALSAEAIRLLLDDVRKARAIVEVIDTDSRSGEAVARKTSPMLDWTSVSDSGVVFEFYDFVLLQPVVDQVLNLAAPQRR